MNVKKKKVTASLKTDSVHLFSLCKTDAKPSSKFKQNQTSDHVTCLQIGLWYQVVHNKPLEGSITAQKQMEKEIPPEKMAERQHDYFNFVSLKNVPLSAVHSADIVS